MPEITPLIGKAKELEVATALTRYGLVVYMPLVDIGADLVVSDTSMKKLIPIQVKFQARSPGLVLDRSYVSRFKTTNLVVAFLIGEGSTKGMWIIPIAAFRRRMKDPRRRDGKVYITVSEERAWLRQFEGDRGAIALRKMLER